MQTCFIECNFYNWHNLISLKRSENMTPMQSAQLRVLQSLHICDAKRKAEKISIILGRKAGAELQFRKFRWVLYCNTGAKK